MIQLKRVLAAVDFSDCSTHAMRYACEFARSFEAELHLLYVSEPPPVAFSEFGIGYVAAPNLDQDLQQAAEKKLAALPDPQWQTNLTVVRTVLMGTPFVEIVRHARDNEIDLIVLGTHGRGAIAHMLMGSTAEKVVRKAPCPVLTVRPEGHEFVSP